MKQQKSKNTKGAQTLLNAYNLSVNLFWSALALVPLTIYCYQFVAIQWLLLFLAPAIVALFLPWRFFAAMQASTAATQYKKMGVHLVNKVSQNGTLVHWLVRLKYPGYKAVSNRSASVKRLAKQTEIFERFHFSLGVFFCLIVVHAFWNKEIQWAVALCFANVFYNIYPCLLQQHIRLKLGLYNRENRAQKAGLFQPAKSFTQCLR